MSRPRNPYIAGIPVDEEGFFGRQDISEWVEQELQNQKTNSLVLFGQRRLGKTSILLRLQHSLPDDLFLPVYFNLQDRARIPLGQLLSQLVDDIREQYHNLALPDFKNFDDQGQLFHRAFLPRLYQVLGDNCRPVFLLDEFDVLDQRDKDKLPETAAAKALFPFLRHIMTQDIRAAFIFVIGRRPDDLSVDIKATFKASLEKEVWVLDPRSAEQLIRQAEVNSTLRFTEKAVKRILSLTTGHPYLTQLLCQRIWQRAYVENRPEVPKIDDLEVESAVPDVVEAGDAALTWLWDGLTLAEKIYAAALAHTAEEGEPIPRDRVIKVLANHSARLHFSEMGLAPRTLVTRRVLNEAGQNEYRFAIEIFRRWVRQRKPLDDIKNELDRQEPEAHRFYQIGHNSFIFSEWQNAINYFQKALDQNPRHFRARLYLGEAQLELGRTEQAVDTLEQAYELDQNDTQLSLLRALREQAEDKAEDEHGLLAVCERILTIYPEDQFAPDKKKYILTRRGNAAFEKYNLEAALADYQAANTPPQIMLIQILLSLTAPTVEDQEQNSAELWAKASDLFGELAKASDEAASQVSWQAKREQYQKRIAERLFKIGKNFFLQNQYEMAIRFFRQTLAVDADHFFAELYLGEGLLEQGKIDEAVSQLEQAYQRKPDKVRQFLTQALIEQAIMLEHAGYEEAALATCQRILQVSPDETAAQEIHNRIWTRRGDIFTENDNFRYAIDAYQKAGNTKRKDAVERLRKQVQLSSREKEARDHECRENWSEAATIYKQLANQALDEKNKSAWQKALDRCEYETKVAQRFSEGLRAIESQNWHKAQAAFREIINHRITYQKDGIWATDLLAKVAKESVYTAPLIPLPVLKASKVISVGNVSKLKKIAVWEARPRIINAVYTLDGELLIITSAEGAYILDPLTLTRVGLLKTNGTAKSFALSGKKVAFGMTNGTIEVRHIEHSSLLYGPLTVHSTVVNGVAFSPDGETLASGANDGTIAFWRLNSGLVQNIRRRHAKSVWDVMFSPNGQLLASASRDTTIKLWDVPNMTLLHTLAKHTRPVWKIAFSADGTNLASASFDRTIRLWQVSHGDLLLTLKEHTRPVYSVAYSPKGTLLASGSRDKTLRLWQVDNGKLLHTISDFEGDVTSVAFAPDGTAIVSVSNNRLVQLWAVKK